VTGPDGRTDAAFEAAAESLSGRVAIVTGAAGDLGRAVCAEFENQGAVVFSTDVTGEVDFTADISTAEGNERLIAAALEAHGRIDTLVLNAGVQFVSPLSDFPLAEWDRLIAVMLSGPFYAMRAAWQELTSRPGARILVTASTSSFVADANKSAYVSAKHGVLGLVKVAALEGAPLGLTANAVAPAWMRTRLTEGQVAEHARLQGISVEDVISQFVDNQAVKRFVELHEVAAVLAFLAGSRSSGITGSCVPVDLGALA
jgi:3-hydroxybutyrate dehydrogenase